MAYRAYRRDLIDVREIATTVFIGATAASAALLVTAGVAAYWISFYH